MDIYHSHHLSALQRAYDSMAGGTVQPMYMAPAAYGAPAPVNVTPHVHIAPMPVQILPPQQQGRARQGCACANRETQASQYVPVPYVPVQCVPMVCTPMTGGATQTDGDGPKAETSVPKEPTALETKLEKLIEILSARPEPQQPTQEQETAAQLPISTESNTGSAIDEVQNQQLSRIENRLIPQLKRSIDDFDRQLRALERRLPKRPMPAQPGPPGPLST